MTRRKKVWLGIFSALLLAVVVLFNLWQSAIERNRQVPVGPFRIAGNLYYVGTTNVTSFLITGPNGHVLIDGAYPETAPMIKESIAKLGYSISDVKILLNSHAHADHAGGLAELKEASGAELWASEGDADIIEAGGRGDASFGPIRYLQFFGFGTFPPVKVDNRFNDGDTIRLGTLELVGHVTAGHTPGCTSWSFPVQVGDSTLLAVSIGSLTIPPFASLVKPESYPGIRQDYERSFEQLRALPADIFLASHTSWFQLQRKMQLMKGAEDSVSFFIDPDGYHKFINREEEDFKAALQKQQSEE